MDENLANQEREAFELQAPSLYTGSGKGKQKGDKGGKKGKGIFFKKKGAIGLIIGLIVGATGIVGGSQLMQPFSLIEQFRETFNSMQTSARTRSGAFMRYQMDTTRTKNPIKGKIFGENTFKITKKQAQKLAAQGIEYDDNYETPDGKTARVLKFDDGTGQVKVVTADADTATRIGGDAIDFNTLYKSNADFYNGYNKGSMTWRGAISNWFGTMTVKFLQSNKITRNLFQDFQRRVEAENNGNTRRAVALEMMAKGADEIVEGGYKTTGAEDKEGKKTVEIDDGNGGKKTIEVDNWEDVDTSKIVPSETSYDGKNLSRADYRSDMQATSGGGVTRKSDINTVGKVGDKLKKISGSVQKGANIACTVFNVLGGISALVAASETLQAINLATGYFEAIDKAKAGDGKDSPVHDLMNALNEKKINTNTVLDSVSSDGTSINTNIRTEKSAMESSGIRSLYSGESVNPKDPSVQSFNFTANIGTILGGFGSSLSLFEACAVAKISANAVSGTLDAVNIVACLVGAAFTFGGSCAGLAVSVAKGVALSVAIGVTVAAVVAAVTPTVASILTRDLITDIGGENLGNALASGTNISMGNAHKANGGSLANQEAYGAFMVAQQEVIADNAKYERQNHSPFDATSKYTFMGTLMNQMMRFASTSSVMSAVTSMSSAVSSSIIAMSPSAMAYDISTNLMDEETFKETCPYLWSIGAVGDAYCNPYVITDMSTIDMDPVDVINKLSSEGNFLATDAEDGNVQIDGDSDLAKYILFCDNRTSVFGMTDWNIASTAGSFGTINTDSAFVNTMSNSAIGAIPVLGDVIDVIGNKDALDNAGYVSGESCVAGNTVNREASPNWEKAKYYQRFIEDQSLAETIGLFGDDGKSAVTAFLDEYYEEHPLDNSYEGILARYSGLTKDDVVALLDFIEYETYIANYDPSERYVFGESEKIDGAKTILFTDENEEKFYNVWWYNNIYDRVGKAETRAKRTEYWVC